MMDYVERQTRLPHKVRLKNDILNKIARPTTHVEALGFQNDIQTNQKLLLLHFQAKGKFLYIDAGFFK